MDGHLSQISRLLLQIAKELHTLNLQIRRDALARERAEAETIGDMDERIDHRLGLQEAGES